MRRRKEVRTCVSRAAELVLALLSLRMQECYRRVYERRNFERNFDELPASEVLGWLCSSAETKKIGLELNTGWCRLFFFWFGDVVLPSCALTWRAWRRIRWRWFVPVFTHSGEASFGCAWLRPMTKYDFDGILKPTLACKKSRQKSVESEVHEKTQCVFITYCQHTQ